MLYVACVVTLLVDVLRKYYAATSRVAPDENELSCEYRCVLVAEGPAHADIGGGTRVGPGVEIPLRHAC